MVSVHDLNKITDQQIEAEGYIIYRNFEDYFTAVQPMTYGKGRIIYAENLMGVDNAWCYSDIDQAIVELYIWNPNEQREPVGWFRNPITGIRRENGNPKKETFEP